MNMMENIKYHGLVAAPAAVLVLFEARDGIASSEFAILVPVSVLLTIATFVVVIGVLFCKRRAPLVLSGSFALFLALLIGSTYTLLSQLWGVPFGCIAVGLYLIAALRHESDGFEAEASV